MTTRRKFMQLIGAACAAVAALPKMAESRYLVGIDPADANRIAAPVMAVTYNGVPIKLKTIDEITMAPDAKWYWVEIGTMKVIGQAP